MDIKKLADDIVQEAGKIIVGKNDKIRLLVMAVLAGGHVLLDDNPGVGKTTLVKTLSIALGIKSGRIQFVPDMLPSDIIGMNIYNQKTQEFELRSGPVVTNLLLADEINRAIPRTQAALLEAMEEKQISIDGQVIKLHEPFIVLATQNPVDSENTFALPAAQMDRFLIKMSIGYPSKEDEIEMLKSSGDRLDFTKVNAVTNAEDIIKAREEINKIHVSDYVMNYIVAINEATRKEQKIALGASPRATKALYRASKSWAAMNGRDFVQPDDVKEMAPFVLSHRLIAKNSFGSEKNNTGFLIKKIIDNVEGSPDKTDVYETANK